MSRLHDHYADPLDFVERLVAAYDAPDLTDDDLDFLAGIESAFHRFGTAMFFSGAQHEYLEALAERGEADEDEEEFEVIAMHKRHGRRA